MLLLRSAQLQSVEESLPSLEEVTVERFAHLPKEQVEAFRLQLGRRQEALAKQQEWMGAQVEAVRAERTHAAMTAAVLRHVWQREEIEVVAGMFEGE